MIRFLEMNAWWISLVLAVLGIFVGVYAAETKVLLGKLFVWLWQPNSVIILLLLIILIVLLFRR